MTNTIIYERTMMLINKNTLIAFTAMMTTKRFLGFTLKTIAFFTIFIEFV